MKKKKRKKSGTKRGKAFKKAAATGISKFKDAAAFVYKHRNRIKEAAELVAAVLGTASQIIGKVPGKKADRRREVLRDRKSKKPSKNARTSLN